MSFLQQLKQQAQQVQRHRGAEVQNLERNTEATEAACSTIWHYLAELAPQLNVLQPAARPLTLDDKTPWPAMKLTDFRFDSRKKDLRRREVTHYIGLVWLVVPQVSTQAKGRVSVNFPTDLERVEARLRTGQVQHGRFDQRHPDTHKLLAYVFEHDYSARCSVMFTPAHDEGVLHLRLSGVTGLSLQTQTVRAEQVNIALMDDLAKAIVGQPSSWG